MSSRFLIPAALVAVTLLVAACSSSGGAPEGFTSHEASGTTFVAPDGLGSTSAGPADFAVGAEGEAIVSVRRVDEPALRLQDMEVLARGVLTNSGVSDPATSPIDVPGATEATLTEGATETVTTKVVSALAGGQPMGYEFIVSSVDGTLSEEQIDTIIDSFEVTE